MAKNFPQKCGKIAIIGPVKKRQFDKIWLIKSSIYLYNIKLLFFSGLNLYMTVLVSRNTVLVKYFLIYKIIRPFHSKIGASQHPLHLHIAP